MGQIVIIGYGVKALHIAIVDDEKIIREHIQNMVEKNRPGCFIDSFASGEELLSAKKYFDIIFLDIQMGGVNGIDIAKKIRNRSISETDMLKTPEETVLIFITGIREYVYEAFDVSAFHYLLKPIEESKFTEVFCRAAKEVERQKARGQEQLIIKTRHRNITLRQNRILYIENRARKLEIHITDREEAIEIYAAMGDLEKQLNFGFYRCHRGYLVNMAYISEYSHDRITISNGETIYLAKERYNAFVKEYMRYLKNGGISFA